MKTVVYLGNIWEYPRVIARLPGVRLGAVIYEEGEDADADAALRVARESGANVGRVRTDADIREFFRSVGPFDIGVIANFGIILSAGSLAAAGERFINFHPGLLPSQPGRSPVRRVWERGGGASGLTVHIATTQVDSGPILHTVPYSISPDQPLDQNILKIYRLGLPLLPNLL